MRTEPLVRTGPPVAPAGADRDPALVTPGGTLTHGELRERIAAAAAHLAGPRRLAMVRARNDVDTVVAELGAMAAGLPVLLVPAEDQALCEEVARRFGPSVEFRGAAAATEAPAWRHHDGPTVDVHDDLALLLTTSGTTGSPKLVRLSAANVASNAAAIVDYLGISAADRALATLPLHYSYGLSVLHSHLLGGAAVVLPGSGVVDPCSWDLAASAGVTTFAGVPHTFALLDRAGAGALLPPTLRSVTQAGGAMAPDDVRRWAGLGRDRGFDFVVMYGQTEATARMAWLPPELAHDHPEAIGIPIPGGSFRLDPDSPAAREHARPAGPATGELVYAGPNVMLGYAETPSDLALGPTIDELHTGDIARHRPDGLWEVVGRGGRIAKPFGLRVDLDHLEALLRRAGIGAACVAVRRGSIAGRAPDAAGAEAVGIAVGAPGDLAPACELVRTRTGLPGPAVLAAVVPELPRRPSGKVDLAAVAELVAATDRPPATDGAAPAEDADPLERVRSVYQCHFRRPVAGGDTFVDLGGDSLSYVEVSMELEAALGNLPPEWHLRTVADLASGAGRRGRLARVEVGAVLRAVGILAVVGRHVDLWAIGGGAHVLMALSGHNFSRFPLTAALRDGRWARLFATAGRVAAPTAMWLGAVVALGGGYSWWNVGFANSFTGPDRWGDTWRYWYVEALVHLLVLAALAFCVPAVRRLARAAPFGLPLGLALAALAVRFGAVELGPPARQVNVAWGVAWLFLLGWAAHRAGSPGRRLLVSALVLAALPGFFGDPLREALVAAALLAVVWVREVPVPRFAAPAVGVVGSASLWIYLTHWQVYPPLEGHLPPWALLAASVAVGIGVHTTWERASARYGAWVRRRTRRDPTADTSVKRPESTAGR